MAQSDTSGTKVSRGTFGHLPDGTAIEAVRLRGDNGFEVRLITFGAAIQSIFAPDRAGRLADVVLGREDLAGYLAVRRFLGATVGRYANRIAGGTFELTEALPAEANDLHVKDLPRLRFKFDRRSHGRLRQMIDLINAEAVSLSS